MRTWHLSYQRFKIYPLWRAFSNSSVFIIRKTPFQCGRKAKPDEKEAFSNAFGLVWAGPKTKKQKKWMNRKIISVSVCLYIVAIYSFNLGWKWCDYYKHRNIPIVYSLSSDLNRHIETVRYSWILQKRYRGWVTAVQSNLFSFPITRPSRCGNVSE